MEDSALASGRLGPLVVVARRAGQHELIDRGAALTYYTVLSLVPGLLVLFSVIGLLGTDETVEEVLSILRDVGPDRSDEAARDPLRSLVTNDTRSGALLGVGIVGVLWTASAFIGSFFRASATIWGVERQPLWRAWPLRVALTAVFLLLMSLALLLITITGQLAQSLGDAVGMEQGLVNLYGFLKWPALLIVVTVLVGLLYRASPSRRRSTRWRVLTPGGAAAMLTGIVVSVGFTFYVNAFATYDSTYGALGTTVAGLVWLWLTNLSLLGGVELDAALELYGDSAVAPDRPQASAGRVQLPP